MTKLSVNINKIATLRNARGGNTPDVLQMALDAERYGANGITVHPRPDERHIKYSDVLMLHERLSTEFNIEGYPSKDFINLVLKVKPAQVTLVPDAPDAITSNEGWNCKENFELLKELVETFQAKGIRTSIFVGTDLSNIDWAAKTGADRIELYTGPYAEHYNLDKDAAIAPFVKAAEKAKQLGIGINAGHDLSLDNIAFLKEKIPYIKEVSIGHALICEALYIGFESTIKEYQQKLKA